MWPIYLLLTIIAIGVLLLSEQGKKILQSVGIFGVFLIILAIVGGIILFIFGAGIITIKLTDKYHLEGLWVLGGLGLLYFVAGRIQKNINNKKEQENTKEIHSAENERDLKKPEIGISKKNTRLTTVTPLYIAHPLSRELTDEDLKKIKNNEGGILTAIVKNIKEGISNQKR